VYPTPLSFPTTFRVSFYIPPNQTPDPLRASFPLPPCSRPLPNPFFKNQEACLLKFQATLYGRAFPFFIFWGREDFFGFPFLCITGLKLATRCPPLLGSQPSCGGAPLWTRVFNRFLGGAPSPPRTECQARPWPGPLPPLISPGTRFRPSVPF